MKDLDDARWQTVDAVLAAVLSRPQDERSDVLRAACGGDPEVYDEVRRLLELEAEAARRIGESATEFAAPLVVPETSSGLDAGDWVGPYRIEAESGRGGMGVVYRARRADGAFEKDVALKLVKRGMDTDEVLRRFGRERQILAGLEHPGIARLLDAGAAPDGRPYLVMEYVNGEPITEYAERNRLGVEARLDLFERVCEAVQHAHRRLVVHRDLKPSNVLVSDPEAGSPQIKLLDFGIARLLDTDEAVTRVGVHPLTPAYAAPEQRRNEAVTTATDVYALGVLLYELLADRRPPVPYAPPSTVAPIDRRRTLRGDLDTIVWKALRPDPGERYPSVEGLLDDLRRYQDELPLHARPASAGYRVRKFVARHRLGVGTALGLVALAVAFVFVYTRGIEQEKRVAQREAARAERMAEVMRELFETADPYTRGSQRGDSLLLERGQAMVASELADEPDLQVKLLTTLGRIYRERGQYTQAQALLDQALGIAQATDTAPPSSVVGVLRQLGGLYSERGQHDEARRVYGQMLVLQRALYGEEAPTVFVTLSLLAQTEAFDGQLDVSERLHRDIVARSRRVHAPTDSAHILSVWKLSRVLYMRGKYSEAEAALREVLAARRARFGEAHPEVAHAHQWLGLVLTDEGDFEGAEVSLRRALGLQRRLLGDEHDDVAVSLFGLGLLANERGDPAEAVGYIEQSAAMSRRVLGPRHPNTIFRTLILGDVLRQQGSYEHALSITEEAVDAYREVFGRENEWVGRALAQKARVLSDAGALADADAAFTEAFAVLDSASTGRVSQGARVAFGELLVRAGRASEAVPILRKALAALEPSTAAAHDRRVLHAKQSLGTALASVGRQTEARAVLRDVVAITREHYGPDHPRSREAQRALAAVGSFPRWTESESPP